jgi:tetratricopeptide (TPR) repeat protein
MRFIAKCKKNLGQFDEAVTWQRRACVEAPHTREPWVELAQSMYEIGDWPQCYASVMNALKVTDRPALYINEVDAWNWLPHDLAAIAAFRMGMIDEAIRLGQQAIDMNPDDGRLANNMRWYRGLITPADIGASITLDDTTKDSGGDSE